MLSVGKYEANILNKYLDIWKAEGLLDESQYDRLKTSYAVSFDWQRLARYLSVLAFISLLTAFGALMSDPDIAFFVLSQPVGCRAAMAAVLAGIFFTLGVKVRLSRHPLFAVILYGLGCVCTLLATWQLGEFLGNKEHVYNFLILFDSVIFFIFGWCVRSRFVWTFAMLAFGSWLGAETGYLSGWGTYFLGMNYPLRFFAFGVLLTAISVAAKKTLAARNVETVTLVCSLLYLYISLWILSIFGSHELGEFRSNSSNILFWSLVNGIFCMAAIVYGCKTSSRIFGGFGLTFFCIELFTKYFEFFWNAIHKAVFFAVLALVCIIIIRYHSAIYAFFLRRNLFTKSNAD